MDNADSFADVVHSLKRLYHSRDPRSRRVGAVVSALADVIEGEVTSGRVYASTISTLEGTLHQVHEDFNLILDSFATQSALLKILSVVVPFVSSPALAATSDLTSRVLRGVVSSCLSFLVSETNGTLLDTKDGLGGLSTVLCTTCEAASEVLRRLPNTTDERVVRQLLNSTLIGLLQDARPKVQNSAREALCGLLLMKSPRCHPAISKATMKYVITQLELYEENPSQQRENQKFIELLGFLDHSIVAIDFTSIAGRLMTILMDHFNNESTASAARPVFVANSHSATLKILTVNAILSTILSLLESENDSLGEATVAKLNAFALRALASLVQTRPALTFRDGAAEEDLLERGQTIFGQVIVSASQRVSSNAGSVEVGAKLLPLVIQQVLTLSRTLRNSSYNRVAETLSAEVSQLFRGQIPSIKTKSLILCDACMRDCLRVITTVVQTPFDESQTPFLKSLTILLEQMNCDDELVKKCIHAVVQLRCDPSLEAAVRGAIERTLVSLIEGVGLEKFWGIVNVQELCLSGQERKATMSDYVWIVDVMKMSGSVSTNIPLHLSFFQNHVLPLARHFDALAVKRPTVDAVSRSQVTKLWSLLSIFCQRPADLDVAFPSLAPILVKAMSDQRYPELIAVICNGMDVLAAGVWERLKSHQELVEGDDAVAARLDSEILGGLSMKLLPALFKIVDSLHDISLPTCDDEMEVETHDPATEMDAARVVAVSQAITSIARLAPKPQIQALFTKVVQRMLQTSQTPDVDKMVAKMCSLLTLSQALVSSECLENSSVSLLYRSLRPLIRTDETHSRIQKRAYKVLAEICKRYHSLVAEPERLQEVMELLSSTKATSQVSARFMRLKCLTFVVDGFDESTIQDRQRICESMVGETLLCLKDSNAKTRDAAFKLLLTSARGHGDSVAFIRVVAAAIASKSPHMRSAAVTALSRLVFELSSCDLNVQNMLPMLLKTVLLLSHDPSREVTKSMVIFARVSVSTATPEQLQPLLPDILNGLLNYHRGKDRYRAKIKIIVKKLVKIFGFDELMPFVPPSDSRLLTHMRKLSEREKRQKNARLAQRIEVRQYDAMVDSDEEDSDDGNTLVTGMTRISKLSRLTTRSGKQTLKRRNTDPQSVARSTQAGKVIGPTMRLKNDQDGHVLDVKELTRKTVKFSEFNSDDSDAEADLEFDSNGKLIVPDSYDTFSTESNNDGHAMMSSKADRSITAPLPPSRDDLSTSGKKKKASARPGSPYKAKRAGGDMKKKGQKYEPYAYVQLDGRNYSKKNRRQAVEQMGSVVQRGNKRQRR